MSVEESPYPPTKLQQQIHDYLTQHPGTTARQIAVALNRSPMGVMNSVYWMAHKLKRNSPPPTIYRDAAGNITAAAFSDEKFSLDESLYLL